MRNPPSEHRRSDSGPSPADGASPADLESTPPEPAVADEALSRTVLGSSDEPEANTVGSDEASLGAWLPSRPGNLHDHPTSHVDPLWIEPGGRIGEYVVDRTLGRGGFGVVYLARQLSLDRQVALKVSPSSGRAAVDGEGRSLARLEHDHIVQVYAEMTEPVTGAHLLCMQYVAGTTLAAVIQKLRQADVPGGRWSGTDLLAVLDAIKLPPVLFDPSALHDRDYLAKADHVESVCRLGEQLASALAHAHARGVLHRDVKPANVLVGRYGRPLLADFNLATRPADRERSAVVGGTLAYMAPEHLDAFGGGAVSVDAIDARCDVYSLAVLLWELSSGELPFPIGTPIAKDRLSAMLHQLASERRNGRPSDTVRDRRLQQVLSRGLAPNPAERYATADEFAETLAGLREQRSALRALPRSDRVTQWAWRFPIVALILGSLLPQFAGSALQLTYNTLRITLTENQMTFFVPVTIAYNLIAYPACLTWLVFRLTAVTRVWQALRRGQPLDDHQVDEARRRSLLLPRDVAIAATIGWLPGAVVFPLALHLGSDPVPAETWGHFFLSFGLAWLIAVTYSFYFSLGVVLRTMYVRFWQNPRGFHRRATEELAAVPNRLRAANVLAGLIPLAAALMLVLITPRGTTEDADFAFRVLTALLILAGGAGFLLVGRRTRRDLETIDACTGSEIRR